MGPLIAMFILCAKMVDMKPKHYLIEVADSPKMPKMESGFDYRELEFEYQQHMHQQNPQGPHVIEGGPDKTVDPKGYEKDYEKADDPSDDAVKAVDIPEEPAGDESKADDPMGYEAKANEDEGSAGKTGEPNGYESKASEDEAKEPSGYEGKTGENDGSAGNTAEPDGYESKASEDEAKDPAGYEDKAGENDGSAGNTGEPDGYKSKASEDEAKDPSGYEGKAGENDGSAGKTGEPDKTLEPNGYASKPSGIEPEKSSPASSAGKIKGRYNKRKNRQRDERFGMFNSFG